jgi:tetratricopeptide (TPR) repeat protein
MLRERNLSVADPTEARTILENILPAYNDPLFSILLIIILALIIALVSYGWGFYKQQKEEGKLLKFLEKFDSAECALNTEDMPFEPHMLKPLTLLAKAFENSGEYHKSISIYLYLIKHINNAHGELELMERLANTYLHAGFLERARSLYTEILRRMPRNAKILHELGIVYENMHRFNKALEIIEPLQLLGEQTNELENFLAFSKLKIDKILPIEEKILHLKALLIKEPKLYREGIALMLKLDTREAWQLIDTQHIGEILDILWFLPNSQLDFDIIANNKTLSTLYYAKGYLEKPSMQSGLFTVDMLAIARKSDFTETDLYFSYLCTKCKQSFPVSFHRCPNCMSINTIKVEEEIARSRPQTDYSLL